MNDEAYEAVAQENRALRRRNLLLGLFLFGPVIGGIAFANLGVWYFVVVTLIDGVYFGSFHYFGDEKDRYLEVATLYLLPFSLVAFVWRHWFAIQSRWPQPAVSPPPGFSDRLKCAVLLAFLLTVVWPPIVMACVYILVFAQQSAAEQGDGTGQAQMWIYFGSTAAIVLLSVMATRFVTRYARRSLGLEMH